MSECQNEPEIRESTTADVTTALEITTHCVILPPPPPPPLCTVVGLPYHLITAATFTTSYTESTVSIVN